MTKTGRFPKKICIGDITIVKISKNDDAVLDNLLRVFKRNLEHLIYWHHCQDGAVFYNIGDMKNYFTKQSVIPYAVFHSNQIIGFIGIGKVSTGTSFLDINASIDVENLFFRTLSYWVDEDYTGQGIMYRCLKSLEKIFADQKLDYLRVNIDVHNTHSIKLVHKMGFEWFSMWFLVDEEAGTETYFNSFIKKLK